MSNFSSTAVLTYWDGRGNAELLRLMLAASGEAWEEKVYGDDNATHMSTPDQFKNIIADGVCAFEQVPLLQIDGLNLVQKQAIVRYLARKHNMYGANAVEAVQIDIVSEGYLDFKSSLKYNDFGDSWTAALNKSLPKFERVLRSNESKSGFFVGGSVSFVDIQMFEILYWGRERGFNYAELGWPLIEAHVDLVAKLPGIAAYLSSPRRFPFPGKEGYFDRVKAVMPWLFGEGERPEMTAQTWAFRKA